MKKITVVLFTAAVSAHAGTFAVGDVAVVEDTGGQIHANVDLMAGPPPIGLVAPGGAFCRDAVKQVIAALGDNYDGVFTFTPKLLDDITNVQQGQPVRWSTRGIGTNTFDWGSQFGSPAKLSQCVFMGSLPKLPANPDGPATALLGFPLGITGTELMGHEYGHHWMTWVHYDKNDGLGRRDMLRGYDQQDPNDPGNLNGHYGYHVDSRSVMYGNFITDNGDGTFTLRGGPRKYGQLDQYLMGLRAPNEVAPTMLLDDGTGHSSPAGAHGPSGSQTVTGMTRVDVTADDVIRAEGPRVPAYPNAQSCWRVAFVLVVPPGQSYSTADVAKVEAYRARWEQWFSWATDGRGTMDARLMGNGCLRNPPPTMDAGTTTPPEEETFSEVPYMTTPVLDDTPVVPVAPPVVPKVVEEPPVEPDTIKLKPGCACGAGGEWVLVLGAAGLLARRRRQRRPPLDAG